MPYEYKEEVYQVMEWGWRGGIQAEFLDLKVTQLLTEEVC